MLRSYLDHLRTNAVLTLQDDNNGTGNDSGIERNRYHGKELVVWRWNFSLSKLLDRSYFNLESSWLLIIWKPKHTKAWHPVTCWDTTWSPDCLIARSKSMQIFYFSDITFHNDNNLIAWLPDHRACNSFLIVFFCYFNSIPQFLGKLIENGFNCFFADPPSLHATVFLVVSCYAPGAPPTIHTETPRDTFTTNAYAYHFSFVICRENLFLPSKYVWGKCILSKYASM